MTHFSLFMRLLVIIYLFLISLPICSQSECNIIGVISLDTENCLAPGEFYINFGKNDWVASLNSGVNFIPQDNQIVKYGFESIETIIGLYPCAPSNVTSRYQINCISEINNSGLMVTEEELDQYDLFFNICEGELFDLPKIALEITCPCPSPPIGPCDNFPFNVYSIYNNDPSIIDNQPTYVTINPTQSTAYKADYFPLFEYCGPSDGPAGPAFPSYDILVNVDNSQNCSAEESDRITVFNITGCANENISIPLPNLVLCNSFLPSTSFMEHFSVSNQNSGSLEGQILQNGTAILTDNLGFGCQEHIYIYNFTLESPQTCNNPVEEPEIFQQFPWLNNLVDWNNCTDESVTTYFDGTYSYLLVSNSTGEILYFENSTILCANAPNFDCIQAYGLSNGVISWSCEEDTENEFYLFIDACLSENINLSPDLPSTYNTSACWDCEYTFSDLTWIQDGSQVVIDRNFLDITIEVPGTYIYTFTANSNITCQNNSNCTDSDPSNPGPSFTYTYEITATQCQSCDSESGIIFFESCNPGETAFYIETPEGNIYQPFDGPGLSFNYEEGLNVQFDYNILDFVLLCPEGVVPIEINCIQENPIAGGINCEIPLSQNEILSLFQEASFHQEFGGVVLEHWGPEVGYFYEITNLCPFYGTPMGPGSSNFANSFYTCNGDFICGYGGDLPPPCFPNQFGMNLILANEVNVVLEVECTFVGIEETICVGESIELNAVTSAGPLPPTTHLPNNYECDNGSITISPETGATQIDDNTWSVSPSETTRYVILYDHQGKCAPKAAAYNVIVEDPCGSSLNCPTPLTEEEIFNQFIDGSATELGIVVIQHFGPEVGYFYEVTNLCPFDTFLAPAGLLSYQGTLQTCSGDFICAYGVDVPLPCVPNNYNIDPALATESQVVYVQECSELATFDNYICSGESVQLANLANQTSFTGYLTNSKDCTNPIITISPTDNVVANVNGFEVTPTETTTYEINVRYPDGTCTPRSIFYTVYVDEDCSGGVPDCENNHGVIYINNCTDAADFEIIRSDNARFAALVGDTGFSLNSQNGDEVMFDFEETNINTDCAFPAENLITLTCIERINDNVPDDEVFKDYPFLIGLIDFTECNGEYVEVFVQGVYTYIYVFDGQMGTLYLNESLWCTDNGANPGCITAYGLTNPDYLWGCADDVNDTCIEPVQDIEAFINSLDLTPEFNDFDPQNVTVTQTIFEGRNYYILINNCTSLPIAPAVVVDCEGNLYCVGACIGGLLDDEVVYSTCEDVGGLPEIFIQYPFLTDLVDPNNCTSEYVLELTSGSSIYLYVNDGIHMSIYTESGDFYCTDFTGFSCMDYYNLTTTGNFWGCNDNILNINICVGDTAFIPGLSMLPFGPQGTPCSSGTCNVVTETSIIPSENATQQGIEGFTVSPSVSTVYFITSTATQQNGSPLPPDPDCMFVPPCQTVSETVIYFVNIVYEDCGDPMDCSSYLGTVFFEDCDDGTEFVFIETDDGKIIDPYLEVNTIFNYIDGQYVSFDYQNANFQTPCSIAEKAVNIICIKEIDRPYPIGIFEEYPWMTDRIDVENCEGTEYIQQFDQGSYSFFYFGSAGFGILYYDDGTLYCIDAANFSCLDAYGLNNGEIVWSCGDIPNTSDCENYSGTIFFDECYDGTEFFFIETSDGLILDAYYSNTIEFNHNDGQSVDFDYRDANFESPCSIADKAIIITCIEETDRPNPGGIFEEYPWLNDRIDTANCEGSEYIEEYDLGSYSFFYFGGDGFGILYYEDGTLYCMDSANFSCLDAYGLTSGQIMWACGDIPNTPDCSNYSGTIFFDECDDGTEYFFIETADGRILDPYYEVGIELNHSDGQNVNFDYREAGFQTPCSIAEQAITITCIEEAEENPEGIFEDYPWLEDEIQYNACELSGHYILKFDQGDYSYFYFGFNGPGNFYYEDGSLLCADMEDLYCIDAYQLTGGEIIWSCGDISFIPTNDCTKFSGTVIVDECDEFIEYFYIETSDGLILDPTIRTATGVAFEFTEGQNINFDYHVASFQSPCYFADQTALISCIEVSECNCTEDYNPVYDAAGNEYSNSCYANCEGVIYYDEVIRICEGDTISLFPDQPSFQDCADIPTVETTWDFWPCTGPCNTLTFSPRQTNTYTAVSRLTSCGSIGGGPSGPLRSETTTFLVVVDPTCEAGGGPENELFSDYPWLNNTINQTSCSGTSVNEYDNDSYAFLYISTPNSGVLYYEDGTLYCTDSPGLDCLQAYSLSNPTATWNCPTLNIGEDNAPTFSSNLEVFPNPTTGFINISFESNLGEESSIRIYDLLGHVIDERQFDSSLNQVITQFDLSGNITGMYIIERRVGIDVEIQKVILK